VRESDGATTVMTGRLGDVVSGFGEESRNACEREWRVRAGIAEAVWVFL
jgi:hypothetical protein